MKVRNTAERQRKAVWDDVILKSEYGIKFSYLDALSKCCMDKYLTMEPLCSVS